MKRSTTSIFIFLCCLVSLQSRSQTLTHRSHLSLNFGGTKVGLFWNEINEMDKIDVPDIEFNYIPIKEANRFIFQLSYDYALKNWLSIGASTSFQKIDIEGTAYTSDVDAYSGAYLLRMRLYRNELALRPLFHFVNKDGMDLYSGVQLGYAHLTMDKFSSRIGHQYLEEKINVEAKNLNGFNMQIIAFGIRTYLIKQLGAHAEFVIGKPRFVALGLNYRF